MEIEFFLPMREPPSTTHQEHQVTVVNGKPIFYEPQRLRIIRQKFLVMVSPHAPEEKIAGPVQLITKWIWQESKKHPADSWKTTKPDTDNMIKLLKDCMTKVGFWKDDSQVASEITEKFYGIHPGIYIKVRELNE